MFTGFIMDYSKQLPRVLQLYRVCSNCVQRRVLNLGYSRIVFVKIQKCEHACYFPYTVVQMNGSSEEAIFVRMLKY